MAELYRNALLSRSIAIAGGVVVIDADIADTQVDPQPTKALGPLYRVGDGEIRWAVVPAASTLPGAAPVDAAGLLVDAVLVLRHLDGAGLLLGHSRPASTAENNGGVRVASKYVGRDAAVNPGDLVYLSVLSVDNPGAVPAIRVIAVNGLTEVTIS